MKTAACTRPALAARWIGAIAVVVASACADSSPPIAARVAEPPPAVAPPSPAPACVEADAAPGAWPRSSEIARAVAGSGGLGHLAQPLGARGPARLRFLGAHLFDLLDKIDREAGPSEEDRRRVICAALEAAARAGAPVVRIWGTLKRTGSPAEVDRAASLLALVLDEDARRRRPIRLIVTLLNHQGGYGAPRPSASLDDQDPASSWSARRLYLGDGWRARGEGQLADRIARLRADPTILRSPNVLAFELVNELDTHRAIAGGDLRGPEAEALRDRFLVPALALLAESFPHPILAGDLRGAEASYPAFARALVGALPAAARSRLVWTSHVYIEAGRGPAELARATRKLDLDLGLAAELGLPFVLGEIGERAAGPARFCGEGAAHDPAGLFHAVLDAPGRTGIEAALFWGEGHCALAVPGSSRTITIGAGGDSADLAPGDEAARAALRAARSLPRFRVE